MIGSTSSTSSGISPILVEIQSRAMTDSINRKKSTTGNSQTKTDNSAQAKRTELAGKSNSKSTSTSELSTSEQTEVSKLKSRDAEVRAHEQAHISAGGNLIRGGASYEYTTGPDNKRYAVGGEVSIDSSPVKNDPKATIQKGERVIRAALAPAKPSSQDYSVASSAQQMITSAQMELARLNASGAQAGGEEKNSAIPQMKVAQAYQPAGETTSAGFDLSG